MVCVCCGVFYLCAQVPGTLESPVRGCLAEQEVQLRPKLGLMMKTGMSLELCVCVLISARRLLFCKSGQSSRFSDHMYRWFNK